MNRVTISKKVEMAVWECPSCGVPYGISVDWADALRAKGGGYCCPNGHHLSWNDPRGKEIAQLKADKIALVAARDSAVAARNKAEAETKRVTRRAERGICPYCNRSFVSTRMLRHIHTKHPEKAHG